MPPLFRHLLALLLLSAVSTSGFAQSLASEQAKLAKLERQNENLAALNTDIAHRLTSISAEIANLDTQSAPSLELEKAIAALALAQTVNENKPSIVHKDKLDIAQFKHALALRKHNKSNPALTRLKKEHAELSKAVNANTQKTHRNQVLIGSQVVLIKTLRNEKATARQAWLRKQEQQKIQADDNSLQKAEQERSEALAEIERLRALLAQQQSQQPRQKDPTATLVAANTAPTQFESFVFLANNNEITAEQSRINSVLSNSNEKTGATFSKFLTIKTYNNGTLVTRETRRLNHIGGAIYQNSVTIPVKNTRFVVGQDEWRVNLPALDDGALEGQASSYTVTLDLRNRELPFLTIYPG